MLSIWNWQLNWFKNANAQNNLGYCYRHGIGIEKDVELFQKLLDKDMPMHRIILAIVIDMELIEVEKDVEKALC